jgi:hypothetical protein
MGLEKKSKDETICEFIKFSKKNENEKGHFNHKHNGSEFISDLFEMFYEEK